MQDARCFPNMEGENLYQSRKGEKGEREERGIWGVVLICRVWITTNYGKF